MNYWCATFKHIRSNPVDNLVFISYDKCCAKLVVSLQRLGDRIGIERMEELTTKAHRFRPPIRYDVNELRVDRLILEKALTLHDELVAMAIN